MPGLLDDYSGTFNPDFSLERLSRESLLKLLNAYSDYIRKIDGHWYLCVMNMCGDDIAFKCDTEVWEELTTYTMKLTSELLNIRGNDVATFLKVIQACPWTPMYNVKVDLMNNNHGTLTFLNCPTLIALEEEGAGREQNICNELEVRLMEIKAHYFNPDIQVTPLKLPPRESGSEICCQWELKLES